jgi:hypothetical protein
MELLTSLQASRRCSQPNRASFAFGSDNVKSALARTNLRAGRSLVLATVLPMIRRQGTVAGVRVAGSSQCQRLAYTKPRCKRRSEGSHFNQQSRWLMGNVLLLSLMIVGAAAAQNEGDQGCSQCGCGSRPKKICRLKVGEGSVTTFEFEVKCEDYCIPGHSKCCGFRWVRDQCGYRGFYKVPVWQAACGCV